MVTLTWLGQAGFVVDATTADGARTRIAIDPWVSPHPGRRIPPPPPELVERGVDWLLVTHEHLDHLDLGYLPALLAGSPGVRVVLPAPVAALVAGIVPARLLVPVLPGDVVDLGGLAVHVVPAFHGVEVADAYGDGSAVGGVPRFVGYVVDSRPRLYHAGDTVADDALVAALARRAVDVALLPINGRDAEREARGIVGNLDAAEAVDLALAVGARTLVPYHWDGVEGNTVPPGSAADAAAGRLAVVVPARFVPLELT